MVREYPSARAYRRDARALYARAGYTVSGTEGWAHRGFRGVLFALVRPFGWPEHLVITYAAPTHPRPPQAGGRPS